MNKTEFLKKIADRVNVHVKRLITDCDCEDLRFEVTDSETVNVYSDDGSLMGWLETELLDDHFWVNSYQFGPTAFTDEEYDRAAILYVSEMFYDWDGEYDEDYLMEIKSKLF